MKYVWLALLAFVPIAAFAAWLQAAPLAVFVLSAIAIIPLAKFIGDSTDDLATHSGPAVGGLLNVTFGNATELIIGLSALNAGLIDLVKASITGSILGNLLLVLGTSVLIGGVKRERQRFNATAAKAAGSQILLAGIALAIPTAFYFTAGPHHGVVAISGFVSILMLLAYAANLFFTLSTHKHLYQEEGRIASPRWSVRTAVTVLAIATVAVACMSQLLVGAIVPAVAVLGWSQLFVGVVVVAIIGNVAEHFSALIAATKDRMDLALQISIGSATQVVLFVAPVLVLAGVALGKPMSLVFSLFELVSILFAVLVTNAVVEDGESNWLEGFQLLTAYFIIAVAFFFYP